MPSASFIIGCVCRPFARPRAAGVCASWCVLAFVIVPACKRSPSVDETKTPPAEVVVYCSVDQEYAERIVAAFEAEHPRIDVRPRFDTEASKTTGLVERLRAERANPQADVFWSSEGSLTTKLAEEGLLRPWAPEVLTDWPSEYRDEDHCWYGFALRARVIAYAPDRVAAPPVMWTDLAEPEYRGRVAMADPNFGTTRGHVATWFALWGSERGEGFLRDLAANDIRIVQSNSQTVREVVNGTADLAMTDTDDVWAARRNGHALAVVYPRHGEGPGMGTLAIPNTVSLIAGRPENEAVETFALYLLSPAVERMLHESDSHNVPVRATDVAVAPEHVIPDPLIVEPQLVAEAMNEALAAANRILLNRGG